MHDIRRWLDRFALAVREVDYLAARRLFAADVVSFGTVAGTTRGLDELVDRQWQQVWGVTRRFRFDPDLVTGATADAVAWAAARWSSEGRRQGGGGFLRTGRATFAFRRDPEHAGGWLAVHSHFSLDPQPRDGAGAA